MKQPKRKQEVGTLSNLIMIYLVLVFGMVASSGITQSIKYHTMLEGFDNKLGELIATERHIVIEKTIHSGTPSYEYTYCDFRKSLDKKNCKYFTLPIELEEFDTGTSWLHLNKRRFHTVVIWKTDEDKSFEWHMGEPYWSKPRDEYVDETTWYIGEIDMEDFK